IGTNGEIVLHHRGQLSSCSTAAGPAFEGAHIRFGMRAAQGAIERVFVESGDLLIHTIGNQAAKGICGSGLIDAVGSLLQAGMLDRTGRLLGDDELDSNLSAALRRRLDGQDNDRRAVLSEPGREPIFLTQRDIREIQLAKGAIATGIEVLLVHAGLEPKDLDALFVAGAFGQYIRVDMAQEIGLLPHLSPDRIHFIGNAACAGAEVALLSAKKRELALELCRQTCYVEISTDPEFQMRYAEHMLF
ncbi:ATP-binding protein, partial [candidate division KSB1 bacterium]|nr:ATP-binding protein [candidate division KSB1 bacterium]